MASRNDGKQKANTEKVEKLSLKKEKLADLNPRAAQTSQVRGQSFKAGTGTANHNETFVHLAPRR